MPVVEQLVLGVKFGRVGIEYRTIDAGNVVLVKEALVTIDDSQSFVVMVLGKL